MRFPTWKYDDSVSYSESFIEKTSGSAEEIPMKTFSRSSSGISKLSYGKKICDDLQNDNRALSVLVSNPIDSFNMNSPSRVYSFDYEDNKHIINTVKENEITKNFQNDSEFHLNKKTHRQTIVKHIPTSIFEKKISSERILNEIDSYLNETLKLFSIVNKNVSQEASSDNRGEFVRRQKRKKENK